NSPLLNDNDIRGAKWILININSNEGEHEFTMDEVEVIQSYLLSQAGENSDVIMGLGYDSTLGNKLGITLIATGFQYKDPFEKKPVKKDEPKAEDKIVMILGAAEEKVAVTKKPEEKKEKSMPVKEDLMAPKLVDDIMTIDAGSFIDSSDDVMRLSEEVVMPVTEEKETVIHWELKMEETVINTSVQQENRTNTVDKKPVVTTNTELISKPVTASAKENSSQQVNQKKNIAVSMPVNKGGYLARPSNIYAAEPKEEVNTPSKPSAEEPVSHTVDKQTGDEIPDMQLVERNDIPAADMPLAHQAQKPLDETAEELLLADEADEQKRRAVERLQKLRNLSFNVNTADPNNEFETVPAYIRRNMELYNTSSHVENFYSNYQVKTDENNNTQISTINTFLDGKKPD
ncbi:MAG: cell division protein FtsZ, partial [Chitinophagaceae bacterium]|nr:cell division protein FtsZ [Chitinophagaceae bacterium]